MKDRRNFDKKDVFFYAHSDVKHYDTVEELTQPCIDLIHDTMIDLVCYSVDETNGVRPNKRLTLLDIGSGTGAEAFRLLDRFEDVHVVCVDFSPEMNRALVQKFFEKYPRGDLEAKFTLIEEDYFSDACSIGNISVKLNSLFDFEAFDCVVAGFFLHHYPTELKKVFYERVFSSLKPGAVLVHGDLFCFQSRSLSRYAHDFGEKWIDKQLSNPDEPMRAKFASLGEDANKLHNKWIHHWNHTHQYNPSDSATGQHFQRWQRDSDSHQDMIVDCGFSDFGIPLRLWEAGVLWARK